MKKSLFIAAVAALALAACGKETPKPAAPALQAAQNEKVGHSGPTFGAVLPKM